MGDITKNLSRKEFACECGCGFDTVDYDLVNALQKCVDHFDEQNKHGVIIVVTSGNRCSRHNTEQRKLYKESNGKFGSNTALNSQHIFARAADFKIFQKNEDGKKSAQVDPETVAQWFEKNYPKFSIGRYPNRTHVDSRSGTPARWDER
jgi:hypothetical protein